MNTAGCKYYTWYDSTEFPANLCVLLSSCDETFRKGLKNYGFSNLGWLSCFKKELNKQIEWDMMI